MPSFPKLGSQWLTFVGKQRGVSFILSADALGAVSDGVFTERTIKLRYASSSIQKGFKAPNVTYRML